ncbi:uncharacterized protein UV8b_00211 [Ustilaginoidea virens]|uniref:Uncharacterized protein n=1 Tax=Ustilaginoidea virens TaxID=1159556 RepID=A0A063BWZ0_USTVR|nr:uncharacterized protein UV8b_00211 [Ustilaginoidea virens]QUC15970.1 hypothetical protein UV8b_00211 [Ustilaginoidea virens]GAO17359.1 hypothetical protein UVI_02038790 [Ustilaginoidea virens]
MASTHCHDTTACQLSASSSHRDAATNLSILLESQAASRLFAAHVSELVASTSPPGPCPSASAAAEILSIPASEKLDVGLAALDIFLQANVTGPVVPAGKLSAVVSRFVKLWITASPAEGNESLALVRLHKACLVHLEVDGVSPYSRVPHLVLFSLARFVFQTALSADGAGVVEVPAHSKSDNNSNSARFSLSWMRLRVNIWHYKLLTQPSLGPSSNFTRSSQWSEVPSLAARILEDTSALRAQIASRQVWSEVEAWNQHDAAYFLVEAANNYILLGRHEQAREALKEATQVTGFKYALSGALGKRTRFQENSVSQLVVLARSGSTGQDPPVGPDAGQDGDGDGDGDGYGDNVEDAKPDALPLNDDTLLEEIDFAKNVASDAAKEETLPPSLSELSPDHQPQLAPLDQIILLTEATLKDAFSPTDALTSQEILPYAVRVLADKSTNWQIYTQALLVRSRIEIHRSRTVERGVLQLQAVADQVLTDTCANPEDDAESRAADRATRGSRTSGPGPDIRVSAPDDEPHTPPAPGASPVPTSFLPAAKPTESAPAHTRLRYIDALSTPPRWHLESELAYAWAGVGSLTSALEIFKRLHLWAEVALCYASAAASNDDDEPGRGGAGGEDKAKAIIRWRLFHPTGRAAGDSADPDDQDVQDVVLCKPAQFRGPEREPAPPNAPRLWCILGDLEDDAGHYERAWAVSRNRYARAQKSLGELHLARRDATRAREAYRLATAANRLSPELWGRLGDICLGLGQFDEAAEAYTRSIGCANDTAGGEDARTWSNLGSAYWSLHCEEAATAKAKADDDDDDDDDEDAPLPGALLAKSLAAYKKGASIAHDNWRIWDNVLTLAARLQPPATADMVLALTHILRIRKTEDAVDADVLAALVHDAVLCKEHTPPASGSSGSSGSDGIYEPPRGSPERLVKRLLEEEIVPLITRRPDLWSLVARLRAWQRDRAGAIDASERAWRAATDADADADAAWAEAVRRTDELVSALQNWGPDAPSVGPKWRAKARSAVRSVMARGARESREDSPGWRSLEGLLQGLSQGG